MYSYDYYKIILKTKLSLFLKASLYKKHFSSFRYAFQNKTGLEIGGPSTLFSTSFLPVYEWAERVDGCNFSASTLWEGAIQNDIYAYYPNKKGHQYILDGTNLHKIEDRKYDFLLSCHNLEHIANPLLALQEWLRVLKPDGYLLLVLPDKRFTFDRYRPYNNIMHLVSDFDSKIGEDDLTHLSEILKLHDLSLDPNAGIDFQKFMKRSQENFTFRGMHHHVFSQNLLKEMLGFFDMVTLDQYFVPPFHQIIIGQKTA